MNPHQTSEIRHIKWMAKSAMNERIIQDAAWMPRDNVAAKYHVSELYVARLLRASKAL